MPTHNLKLLIPIGIYRWHHHNLYRLFFMVVWCNILNSVLTLGLGEVVYCRGMWRPLWLLFLGRKTLEGEEHTALILSPILFCSVQCCVVWLLLLSLWHPCSSFWGSHLSLYETCISQTSGAYWLYGWHIIHIFKERSIANFKINFERSYFKLRKIKAISFPREDFLTLFSRYLRCWTLRFHPAGYTRTTLKEHPQLKDGNLDILTWRW